MTEQNDNLIFSKGIKVTSDNFIGEVWLKMLVTESEFNCPVYNVTFEPGARNNWHVHPGGQILLVTSGKGWYQEEGQPAQSIQAGDVIKIKPNIKHWHGASADSQMVHVGITTNLQNGNETWLEPVGDKEYDAL